MVCRFSKTESRWGYSGTSDRIRFVVDRRIFVIGFGLYGSIHGPSDYESNIQIIHTGTGKILASNDTQFSCDGSSRTFRVCFKMPVEILANTNYTACATLKVSLPFLLLIIYLIYIYTIMMYRVQILSMDQGVTEKWSSIYIREKRQLSSSHMLPAVIMEHL